MKKLTRRLLASVLAIVMVMSCMMVAFAVETEQMDETNAGTVTVYVSNVTVEPSDAEQTVNVVLLADKNIAIADLALSYAGDDVTLGAGVPGNGLSGPITTEGMTVSNTLGTYMNYDATNDGYVLCTIPVTVAAGATGTYEVTLSGIEIYDADNGDGYTLSTDSVTATITVNESAPDDGGDVSTGAYTATVASAATGIIRVGDTFKVNIGTNQTYAATEMTVTYPSDLVSFDEENSTLGTAAITDNTAGTLTLAHYGEDKAGKADNYVLAFKANANGEAAIAITKAGFGTGTSAADANLTAVATPGSVTVEIIPAQLTVNFADEYFYAENMTVNAGESFTFYPEQTTGGYYDYTLPTATMGGQTVTVTPTEDGGWTIENVTGDIAVNAAQRTPKNFGAVTYGGTGAADITNKTENAVYLTDITFTIPADKEADTEAGYKYTLAVKIGESSYNYADGLVTDEAGNRTYTIKGEDVKGAVTVTVDKTVIEANKITVTIGGNAAGDGKYEGAEGTGAIIQVEKGGNATLTVDTTTGFNKGYNYEVKNGDQELTLDENGSVTIENITEATEITINRTLNVDEVKNMATVKDAEGNEVEKNFVALNGSSRKG